MGQKNSSITVPEDAIPGDILHEDGRMIGVVLSIQEDGRAIIQLTSQGTVANVPMEGDRIRCDSCESDKVYHDTRQEWLCPWCEL